MKAIKLLGLFSIALLLSCNKSKDCCIANPLTITWVAASVDVENQFQTATNEIIMTLHEEGQMSIKLDINTCGGDYSMDLSEQTVAFKEMFCTEACCDSEFAQNVVDVLLRSTRFETSGNTLTIFAGDDKANFLPKE
ncbi:MAG: META domain-containing protein [Bacteroidota bacterium]